MTPKSDNTQKYVATRTRILLENLQVVPEQQDKPVSQKELGSDAG